MKFVLFWETTREPQPRETGEKAQEAGKDIKMYGKTLLEPHFYAENKGLSIVEFDNLDQLANRKALAFPVKIKAMHLLLGTEFGEAMSKHRKR